MVRDLMYNPNNGNLLLTVAKVEGKIYQDYLAEGYIKIGTASGYNMTVKGIVK